MKVILLKDIKGVGRRFEEKEVANGYAANFLIPRQMAKYSSPQALKEVEQMRAQKDKNEAQTQEKIEELLKNLHGVKMEMPANDKGHLFKGVGKKEISKTTGIPEDLIVLDEALKEIGEHQVIINIGGKEKKLTLEIIPSTK